MKINIGKNEISYKFRNRIIFVNNDRIYTNLNYYDKLSDF